MKKMIVALFVASAFAMGSAWAGGACCPSKKGDQAKSATEDTVKVASAEAAKSCDVKKAECFEGLNLNEGQQAKVKELMSDCDASKCSLESKAKFHDGLKDILTVRQYDQMKDACSKLGCSPSAKTDVEEDATSKSAS